MSDKYSRLVASSSATTQFVTDVVSFLEDSGFDGLELQWQYPSCWWGSGVINFFVLSLFLVLLLFLCYILE